MLCELRDSNIGIIINGTNATSPAHADDLALVAPYRLAMNKLLSIAYNHSIVWFYDFGIVNESRVLGNIVNELKQKGPNNQMTLFPSSFSSINQQ